MPKHFTFDKFNEKYAGSCFNRPPNVRKLPIPTKFIKEREESNGSN